HRQVVRNGHLPERTLMTGSRPVSVRQPRVLDRRPTEEAEPFSSKILPPYLRKTKSSDELLACSGLVRAISRIWGNWKAQAGEKSTPAERCAKTEVRRRPNLAWRREEKSS